MAIAAHPLTLLTWYNRVTDLTELETLSDEELLRSCSTSNQDPFRVLVRRYKDRVFGLAMRQLGDHAASEDITQEVFIRVFRGLSKFRYDASFSTWLTRIALNQINSYFTSRRFRESQRSQPFDIERHDTPQPSHDAPPNEEQLRLFRVGLAKLKPMHREVLVLCGLEERSYEDAAQILNIPIGTVRSRLNYARLHLTKIMNEL